jgi:hypothetical protein
LNFSALTLANREETKAHIFVSVLDLFFSDAIEKTRWRMRMTLVSTKGTSIPAPKHSTAFAVYSPTPGKVSSYSLSRGTPPNSDNSLARAFRRMDLLCCIPKGVIIFSRSVIRAFARESIVGYLMKNLGKSLPTCFLEERTHQFDLTIPKKPPVRIDCSVQGKGMTQERKLNLLLS